MKIQISNTAVALSIMLASCVTVQSANAADLGPYRPYDRPIPEPVVQTIIEAPIWQGAYVGINGGYGWGSSGSTDPSGAVGGVQIGYNRQIDRFVYGIEGDFQLTDMNDSSIFSYAGGFGAAESDINWFSTVRGRVGLASGPMLFYATGGVAFADIDNTVRLQQGPTTINFDKSSTQTGYVVGGGIEWAFSPKMSAKVEYLYMDFGDDKLTGLGSDGNVYATKIANDAETVRVGLNYKF